MTYFEEYTPLFEKVGPQTLVLSPNQRLSRFITEQFSIWTKNTQHAKSWPKLSVFSYQQWLTELRISTRPTSIDGFVALSGPQEDFLWRSVIEGTEFDSESLDPKGWASIAKQAWANMRAWNKKLEAVGSSTEDWLLFCRWVRAFEDRKARLRVTDSMDTQIAINTHLSADTFHKHNNCQSIYLIGFDHFTPVQNQLFNKVEQFGVKIEPYAITLNSHVARRELSQYKEEIQQAAVWAREKLEANPLASIGIVSLDLGQKRAIYEEIFSRIFYPQNRLTQVKRVALPINVSAGEPLGFLPLIISALDLLSLNKKSFKIEYLLKIFKSPFWSFNEYSESILSHLAEIAELQLKLSRTELLSELRSLFQYREIPLHHLEPIEEIFGRTGLKAGLKNSQCRSLDEWGVLFLQQLRRLGWPGNRTLDSIEFQQVQQFQTVIKDLCTLSMERAVVSFDEAFEQLKQLCYRPFQAQTKKSPIQVLGVLEASGMQFDYLWVLGMDNNSWPEKTKPNPLIPQSFQVEHAFPRANPVEELLLAERITHRLKNSAYEVVFSSSFGQGDEPLKPSALIANIPLKHGNVPPFPDIYTQKQGVSEQLADYFITEYLEKTIPGGSQALKSQSACPFQATARFRLNARNYRALQPGVSPLTRGLIVHECLEVIWKKLGCQSNLKALSTDDLEQAIKDALYNSWIQQKNIQHISAPIKTLELERNARLIKQWFDFEKSRDDFSVISCEQMAIYKSGGHELRLRIDRIDQLEDGALLVMDYKTGSNSPSAWAGERPDDPQLPLYVIVTPQSRAVAYAQIHPKLTGLIGIAADDAEIGGLKKLEKNRQNLPADWPLLVDFWKKQIGTLMAEFSEGLAVVNPKSINSSCEFCELSALCRIKK